MKSQERVKRKGQSFQETVTGKLATYTKEHHWPSSRSYRNLAKNPPFCTWSSFLPESSEMDLQSAFSWTQETSTSSSFLPLAVLLVGTEATPLLSAWTQPRYPEASALTVLRRQSSHQLVTKLSLKANILPLTSERGLAPQAGHQRRVGSPALTDPRRLTQNQLCCEHSDWKPKLKWSQKSP